MINALVQKYRRYKLIQMLEANNRSHLPYIEYGDDKMVFDLAHGELVYWDVQTLTKHSADKVQLPPIRLLGRLSRKYTDNSIERIARVINHMLAEKYAPQAGVKLLTLDDITWYVSPLSQMHDDTVVLMAPDRDSMFVPSAIISSLPWRTIGDLHPYTVQPIDLCCGGAYSAAKPVIKLVELPASTKEAAVTYKREIPGAQGIYDHVACDLIIDISQLDNSSQPVIDVAEFCYILAGSSENPRSYTVDVSRIKLRLGMFPQPIEVRRLKDEVGEHRVIFSSEPYSDESNVDYINADSLPNTYP